MANEQMLMGLLKTPSQVRRDEQQRMMEESMARSQQMLTRGGTTALPGIISAYGAQAAQRGTQAGAGLLRGLSGGIGSMVGGETGQRIADLGISAQERQAREEQKAIQGIDYQNIDSMKAAYARLVETGTNPMVLERLADRISKAEETAFDRAIKLRELSAKGSEVPKTRSTVEGEETVTYQWNRNTGSWDELARGPRYKPGTTVNISEGAEAFDVQLGKDMSEQLKEARGAVDNASKGLQNLAIMEDLLDQGVITGSFANSRTAVERALATAGLIDGQRVSNTETFLAAGAQQTLALLQTGAAGAGTGISDADREFMEKAAGGNITVTEEAIRRIIRINRQIAQNVYGTHNKIVGDIKQTFPESQAAQRISDKYYPGQRAKDAEGNILIFDPTQGWVIEQ